MARRTLLPLSLLTALVASTATADAQPVAAADGPGPEVRALSSTKRLTLVQSAVKRIGGSAPSSVPAAQFRLLPGVAANNGARISAMGMGKLYVGDDGNLVQASFVLQPRTANDGVTIVAGFVEMQMPTVANKLYAIDCRVFFPGMTPPTNDAIFQFKGAMTNATVDEGHVVFAFRAAEATALVTLKTTSAYQMTFRGCEITKVE